MVNLQVKKSEIHGNGLFTNNNLSEGQLIMEIDDSNLVHEKLSVSSKLRRYLDYNAIGKVVLLKGQEKYMNWPNDDNPNTLVKVENNKRFLYASRFISNGDELTTLQMMNL